MANVFACDRCGTIIPVPKDGAFRLLLARDNAHSMARVVTEEELAMQLCVPCAHTIRSLARPLGVAP